MNYLVETLKYFYEFFIGKPCTVILYDNSKVKATFVSTTGSYNHIAVEDLQTPIGIVASALIRTIDIQSLKVDIGNVGIHKYLL